MKFSFVVLHYVNFQDTYECIESLLNNIYYDNYSIIIVDNSSPNDSFSKLQVHYGKHTQITLLKTEENLGFAKGNNVGFAYAKNIEKADFIVLINNDTIIEDSTFINKIKLIHKEHGFNILGPDILSTKDKLHQNPQRTIGFTYEEVKSNIKKLKILLSISYFKLDNAFLYILKKTKEKLGIKESNGYNSSDNWSKEMTNVQLHGACLIFDPYFVNNYNGLYEGTFMYAEEDILFFQAQQNKLKILYSPRLQILHKEGGATDLSVASEKKRQFIYRNSLHSLIQLKKMMKNTSNRK